MYLDFITDSSLDIACSLHIVGYQYSNGREVVNESTGYDSETLSD